MTDLDFSVRLKFKGIVELQRLLLLQRQAMSIAIMTGNWLEAVLRSRRVSMVAGTIGAQNDFYQN